MLSTYSQLEWECQKSMSREKNVIIERKKSEKKSTENRPMHIWNVLFWFPDNLETVSISQVFETGPSALLI